MARYRKKPVVIEAFKLYTDFIPDWFMDKVSDNTVILHGPDKGATITTLEGDHLANPGDFIIKGVKGELYPCKPDIFEATYEPVESLMPDNRPICARCKVSIPPMSKNLEPFPGAKIKIIDPRFDYEGVLCEGCSGVLHHTFTGEHITPYPWEKKEKAA